MAFSTFITITVIFKTAAVNVLFEKTLIIIMRNTLCTYSFFLSVMICNEFGLGTEC